MPDPGSYGASDTSTPSTPLASVPQPSVAAGTFPTTPVGEGLGVNGLAVANISVNDFISNYQISPTEQNTFITVGSDGKPHLNQNALFLMQYKAMGPTQRENYQQSMVNAGIIPQGEANGINNPVALAGFKTAIANSAATGVQVDQYLNQYSGTNNVDRALSVATANAQREAQASTVATVSNPSTLSADITKAFTGALGYAPDKGQIDAFVNSVQGQDVAVAQAPHEAAKQQLAQLKSDQSALSKLGANGIDAVIDAYATAIHDTGAPGAGTTQGPQNGSLNTSLPVGTMGPMGEAGPAATQQEPNHYGPLGAMGHNLSHLFRGGQVTPQTDSGTTHGVPAPAFNTPPNPNVAPIGVGSIPTYGGMYALTPGDWTQAQKLSPQLAAQVKKNNWTSAGLAPINIQHSALTSLLSHAYDSNGGSWADAIITVASGGHANASNASKAKVLGTNLHTFATGIASKVNDQLTALTNDINNNNVTVKTSAPDAAAEANLAAKNADPIGYTSVNYSSWASTLSQMLYGPPSTAVNQSSDAFTGPVAPPAAPTQAVA